MAPVDYFREDVASYATLERCAVVVRHNVKHCAQATQLSEPDEARPNTRRELHLKRVHDGHDGHGQVLAVLLVHAAPDELRIERRVAGIEHGPRRQLLVGHKVAQLLGRNIRPLVLVADGLDLGAGGVASGLAGLGHRVASLRYGGLIQVSRVHHSAAPAGAACSSRRRQPPDQPPVRSRSPEGAAHGGPRPAHRSCRPFGALAFCCFADRRLTPPATPWRRFAARAWPRGHSTNPERVAFQSPGLPRQRLPWVELAIEPRQP